MNKGMSIEAALVELQKPLNGPHARDWAFGPAVRTLIAALEQAHTEAKEFRHRLRNEQALLESADKRIDELENDEVRQRLANAEHQLHMAELAKHNLKASRRAQFRKRLAAERRASELESSLIAPGIMRCAKCEFVLTKNSINMAAGTITAGDSKTEPCPNGCGPLWPVTWKEQALDMRDSSEQWFEDLQAANKRIAELEASKLSVKLPDDLGGIINRFKYEAGHLTGWHHIDEHSCKVNRRDLMTATDLLEAIRATGIALDTGE